MWEEVDDVCFVSQLVTNKEQEGQRPTTNQDSTSQPVIVHEVDQMGRYIKLHNESDQVMMFVFEWTMCEYNMIICD